MTAPPNLPLTRTAFGARQPMAHLPSPVGPTTVARSVGADAGAPEVNGG